MTRRYCTAAGCTVPCAELRAAGGDVCPLDVERSKPPKLVIEPGPELSPELTEFQSKGRGLRPKNPHMLAGLLLPIEERLDRIRGGTITQIDAERVLRRTLANNDPTLPPMLGNNTLSPGQFETLRIELLD